MLTEAERRSLLEEAHDQDRREQLRLLRRQRPAPDPERFLSALASATELFAPFVRGPRRRPRQRPETFLL